MTFAASADVPCLAITTRGTDTGLPKSGVGDTENEIDAPFVLIFGRGSANTMLFVDSGVEAESRAVDPLEDIRSIADQVDAIKNVAALTDEEVAGLLGTSRQTLYNWRQGRKISARREQRLEQTLEVIRALAGDSPRVTRRTLMAAEKGQVRVYDLLAEGSIEAARAVAGGYALPTSKIPSEYPLATQMGLLEDRAPTPKPKIDKRFSKRL